LFLLITHTVHNQNGFEIGFYLINAVSGQIPGLFFLTFWGYLCAIVKICWWWKKALKACRNVRRIVVCTRTSAHCEVGNYGLSEISSILLEREITPTLTHQKILLSHYKHGLLYSLLLAEDLWKGQQKKRWFV
jgi:4-amino-4-deoxy-L-arabinose transferase-like glycosyltransferase